LIVTFLVFWHLKRPWLNIVVLSSVSSLNNLSLLYYSEQVGDSNKT